MATAEEIQGRVKQADTARSAKRAAAAQQVGALAERRAAIAQELADIEGQLGDVLATASEVMDMNELAAFTDVPASDLTRWLTARKPNRGKRKKPAASADDGANRGSATAKISASRPSSAPTEPASGRSGEADVTVRVDAEVA